MDLFQRLVEHGRITPAQADSLRSRLDAERPLFGHLAREMGLLSLLQILKVVSAQRSDDRSFGEIAVALGFLRPEQVEAVLAEQARRMPTATELVVSVLLLDEAEVQALSAGA